MTSTDNHQDEILLRENPNRFVLFPIKYDKIWEMYKKQQKSYIVTLTLRSWHR